VYRVADLAACSRRPSKGKAVAIADAERRAQPVTRDLIKERRVDLESHDASDGTAEEGTVSRLKHAIRKARIEAAERSEVIAELRSAEIARLEMLEDALRPILADVPQDVEMFEMGLLPGGKPRLFIDMIGFVEMNHDLRTYRFVQATRYGQIVIAQNEQIEPIVNDVTDYVAHRLIEREKALAGSTTLERAARIYADAHPKRVPKSAPMPPPGLLSRSFTFLIEVLGSALLFVLLAIGIWNVWRLASVWLSTHH
jgi:hypothetical protein